MKNLFISHAWVYHNQYDNLVNLLENSNLVYKNYSVPKDDPIHSRTNTELRKAIVEKRELA